jgi:hypothetical protein
MRKLPMAVVLFLCGFSSLSAGEPAKNNLVLDLWDAAYLKNGKAGYVHTFTEEIKQGNETLLRTTVEFRLTVKRNEDVIQLRMDNGTIETLEGKVVGVFMKQYLGKDKTMELAGKVVDGKLRVQLDGKELKAENWDPRVVGLFRQQMMFKEKQCKTGDTFDYLSYEPSINAVVPTFVRVKDHEEVELFGDQQKKKLLRVEIRPAKIDKVQMPPLTLWLAENRTVQRSQVDVPGLGMVVQYRASKAVAMAPGPLTSLTDIGLTQSVPLKVQILNPYDTYAAVYQVTVRGDVDPGSTFSSSDPRQQIKNIRGNTFELHVRSVPAERVADKKPGVEFTQSSYFINSADPLVKKHAQSAVGNEKDAWKKSILIEKWVHDNVKATNNEALATADHVAKTLEGDCTEFAMLMAAMCRAEGVPSRTAVGLVYADVKEKPCFAFHMWTEVYAGERWVPLDATLGRGKVAATHLKIADQSWHEVRTMIPLFPVMRVMGRVSIDVLSVENLLKP